MLAALPASDQLVQESTLKAMLLSLKKDIYADFHSNLAKLNAQIELMEEQSDHLERKMGEYPGTINCLVDGHHKHPDDTLWLKSKVADFEDRSRRNNLNLRGDPEMISQPDVLPFTRNYLKYCCQKKMPLTS